MVVACLNQEIHQTEGLRKRQSKQIPETISFLLRSCICREENYQYSVGKYSKRGVINVQKLYRGNIHRQLLCDAKRNTVIGGN